MKILIVEDNNDTASYLSQGFKENHLLADIAHDGEEGLYLATNHSYDIIILDVMLPGLDGWSLLKKIREDDIHIPIIFLTACDAIEQRVKGLELGADDYLIKPFSFSELIARVRTVLRRKDVSAQDSYCIADLKIDTKYHTVSRAGKKLILTNKEFMLLLLFIRKQGEVLTRTYIAEQVWDINFDSDTNAIEVAIKRLRDKVDKLYENKLIHNIRGVGYVLAER